LLKIVERGFVASGTTGASHVHFAIPQYRNIALILLPLHFNVSEYGGKQYSSAVPEVMHVFPTIVSTAFVGFRQSPLFGSILQR